ncbi:MAG: tRNA 2-thiouridine(34) synthase MnmA [Sulfuritalea sp.]|nr:tRNA 2-thiouridine(34) synthase MnmA [Sulfuritalea sp.]
MSKGKIIVGLSGGVDSSVAALLLKREGYKVVGLFMKNWEDDDDEEYCSSRQDLVDAAAAADVIGIEFEAVNFSAEYRDRVFADFLREYQAGRTPNPDVLCNSEIKFKAFLDHALQLGADKIATGHYAQVREFLGQWQLLKAEDGTKDQSYFLHRLNQAQLAKTLFPVGHLYKRDVRRIAEEAGLPNHARKDSTGICFIGERPFREFLARYLPRQPGEIRVLGTDRVIGMHEGMMYYTLGQREGLGIGGVKGAPEEPWFVAGKDMEKNVLWVVQGHEHPALLSRSLVAQDLSWVAGSVPHTHWVYAAKTRYRQPDAACEVERISNSECEVVFAEPQWAVTPGQSLVLYESRVCLGGGIIATSAADSD